MSARAWLWWSKLIENNPHLRALPSGFITRARQFYAEQQAAVPARPAATVMLLRDQVPSKRNSGGIEVYLLKRASTMAFAGGLYAFPGGRMDADDIDVQSTAVREVREETGVRVAELHAWSRWITPEFEPRRYDTWFYVARLPDGRFPQDISGEASWAGWMEPWVALDKHQASLLPPTAVALAELAEHMTVDSVLTAAEDRDLTPIVPRVVLSEPEPHLALPGDAEY